MLKNLLSSFLLLVVTFAVAQEDYQDKLSASMKLFLANGANDKRFVYSASNQKYVSVFIELNDTSLIPMLAKSGVRFRTIIKTIATADIPIQEISRIALMPVVKRIELPLLFQKTDTLVNK